MKIYKTTSLIDVDSIGLDYKIKNFVSNSNIEVVNISIDIGNFNCCVAVVEYFIEEDNYDCLD